jgi:predicted nucleotidyltransferase
MATAGTYEGARIALVGGLAVSARAEPRLTRDIDLAVSVASDVEAEALVLALRARGYVVRASVEQEAVGRLATVRLGAGGDDRVVVDLLFASSGIEPEVVAAAEQLEVVPGVHMPIATTGHLIALKLLARDDRHRPVDADDLAALREVVADTDWETAAAAVALIEARGYGRGRDLATALEVLQRNGAW